MPEKLFRLNTLQIVHKSVDAPGHDIARSLGIYALIGQRIKHEVLTPDWHVAIAMPDDFRPPAIRLMNCLNR